jgi:arylsulfatase A-like enzyme
MSINNSRRSFLKTLLYSGIYAVPYSFSPMFQNCSKEKEVDNRPNFIILVADDLGWADVGYHESEISTPYLNKMSDFGVTLSRFYTYPTCSPTRASLLTGKPASRFGIFSPIAGRSTKMLPDDVVTLPQLLKQNGYATAITGKWHLGLRPEVGPNVYGFEYAYGYLHGQIDQYSHEYKNGDPSWHKNGKFITEEGHATDLITKEAINFIKKNREKDKPFFLYVPFSVPHYPLQESNEWVSRYRRSIKDESRRLFAASVTHMDDAIGKLLESLKEENLQTNTLVLFISDNGGQKDWYPDAEYNGKHGPNKSLGNNKPFKGWKGDLYEGGIRVPAVALWFSKLSRQNVTDVIHVMDIYPTIANLAGISLDPNLKIEGKNIWNTLLNNEPIKERVLYWRTNNEIALRKGIWKLINKGKTPEVGQNELYNLYQDPYESIDFSLDYPEKVAELLGAMKKQFLLDEQS